MPDACLFDPVRAPSGRLGGGLAHVWPRGLASCIVRTFVAPAPSLDAIFIDEVVSGDANKAGDENRCVTRMAFASVVLPLSAPGSTMDGLGGSSMDAAIVASPQVVSGDAELVLLGGVVSLSRGPWLARRPAKPFPSTDATLMNTVCGWRLENPWMPTEWTVSLGEATEQFAEVHGISRETPDNLAARSHGQTTPWECGAYGDPFTPVSGTGLIRDESLIPDPTPETLSGLGPIFCDPSSGSTVTARNASLTIDGAAEMWLGSNEAAQRLGRPLARNAGRGPSSNDPGCFEIAPVEAVNLASQRACTGGDDVGALELNESFPMKSLACLDEWPVYGEIVNEWGGAIASGARSVHVMGSFLAKDGRCKVLPACAYPATGVHCACSIHTERAVFDVVQGWPRIREVFRTRTAEVEAPLDPSITIVR